MALNYGQRGRLPQHYERRPGGRRRGQPKATPDISVPGAPKAGGAALRQGSAGEPEEGSGESTWFMPALTKRRRGSPRGRTGAEGRRRWPWRSSKKRRKAARICLAEGQAALPRRGLQRQRHGTSSSSRRSRAAAAMVPHGGWQRRDARKRRCEAEAGHGGARRGCGGAPWDGGKAPRRRPLGSCAARAAPVAARVRSRRPSRPAPSHPAPFSPPPQRSLPPVAAGGRHGGARGAVPGLVPPPSRGQWRLAPAGGRHAGERRWAPAPRSGWAGTALGAQFGGVSWFLTALPRRGKRRLVPLKEQPPFGAVWSGRRSTPVTPEGGEGGPRRWSRLGQAFACLYL